MHLEQEHKPVRSIGIEYQPLNLTQRQVYTDIDTLMSVREAQQKGKALLSITLIDLSLVPRVSIDTTDEAVKDC
jgi:hypothetical protein